MKLIKTMLAVLALGFSINAMAAMALTDDQSVEFTDAIGRGDMKIVKKYVEGGVDVNATYFAWSPIQMAATKGKFETVKYLTEKGADVNYVHPLTKMTAFHLAAYDGFSDIVKYLAEHGADVNKKMRADVDIIRVVKDTGNTKMVELLKSLGVKEDGCQDEKCL
ncbi:MAG TPA: ankyrin repeat domain-containing protein [Methylotenera sp.]|nr:ankyrin repeat domain-containing protein [Methylotenera sp.]